MVYIICNYMGNKGKDYLKWNYKAHKINHCYFQIFEVEISSEQYSEYIFSFCFKKYTRELTPRRNIYIHISIMSSFYNG